MPTEPDPASPREPASPRRRATRTPRARPPGPADAVAAGQPVAEPPAARGSGAGSDGGAPGGGTDLPGLPDGASGPELARAVLDAALAHRRQSASSQRRRTPDGSYVEGVGADGRIRRRLRG